MKFTLPTLDCQSVLWVSGFKAVDDATVIIKTFRSMTSNLEVAECDNFV